MVFSKRFLHSKWFDCFCKLWKNQRTKLWPALKDGSQFDFKQTSQSLWKSSHQTRTRERKLTKKQCTADGLWHNITTVCKANDAFINNIRKVTNYYKLDWNLVTYHSGNDRAIRVSLITPLTLFHCSKYCRTGSSKQWISFMPSCVCTSHSVTTDRGNEMVGSCSYNPNLWWVTL